MESDYPSGCDYDSDIFKEQPSTDNAFKKIDQNRPSYQVPDSDDDKMPIISGLII